MSDKKRGRKKAKKIDSYMVGSKKTDYSLKYSDAFGLRIKRSKQRSVKAINRTKLLDIGFFWMEFYPISRALFLDKYRFITGAQFEMIMQLHAIQPFGLFDFKEMLTYSSLRHPNSHRSGIPNTYGIGPASFKLLFKKLRTHKVIEVVDNNSGWGKREYSDKTDTKHKLFCFTKEFDQDITDIYLYMLCLKAIPTNVSEDLKSIKSIYRKILKQRKYCKAMIAEEKLNLNPNQVVITLGEVRPSIIEDLKEEHRPFNNGRLEI